MSNRGWIGVDLDGTLAVYNSNQGLGFIGAPIPLMVDRVRQWIKEGQEVRIMTARVCEPERVGPVTKMVHEWLDKLGLPQLQVTCRKDYSMVELWDDRAVRVEKNTGRRIL